MIQDPNDNTQVETKGSDLTCHTFQLTMCFFKLGKPPAGHYYNGRKKAKIALMKSERVTCRVSTKAHERPQCKMHLERNTRHQITAEKSQDSSHDGRVTCRVSTKAHEQWWICCSIMYLYIACMGRVYLNSVRKDITCKAHERSSWISCTAGFVHGAGVEPLRGGLRITHLTEVHIYLLITLHHFPTHMQQKKNGQSSNCYIFLLFVACYLTSRGKS